MYKETMSRRATDDFEAVRIANAMMQAGADVFSVYHLPSRNADDPVGHIVVCAKVVDVEQMNRVDEILEGTEQLRDEISEGKEQLRHVQAIRNASAGRDQD